MSSLVWGPCLVGANVYWQSFGTVYPGVSTGGYIEQAEFHSYFSRWGRGSHPGFWLLLSELPSQLSYWSILYNEPV